MLLAKKEMLKSFKDMYILKFHSAKHTKFKQLSYYLPLFGFVFIDWICLSIAFHA